MHILFTAYEFVTEKKACGGFGHYLANISTILAEHNHRVTILLITDYNKSFEWKKNIRVIAFKYKYVNKGIHIERFIDCLLNTEISSYVNKSLAFKEKILELKDHDRIDIVQYNGDHLEGWHRLNRIPTVIRLSSFPPWYKHAYNLTNDMDDLCWLDTYESKLFLHPLKKVDGIYGPSKCTARLLRTKLNRKIRIIESPFVIKEINGRELLPIELKQKNYFLFFGRICILKGINTIIECIYKILDEYRDFYFVFAGNHEQQGLIKRLIKEAKEYKSRVIIYGEIKDEMVMQQIVKNAYLCVLPSRADNLPNACIEAMGMGKIVIGTMGASFEQLIKNKHSGILIQRDSSKSLIKGIRYVMGLTKEEKQQMEQNAIIRIQQMYPEIIYQEIIEYYKSIIKRGKNK